MQPFSEINMSDAEIVRVETQGESLHVSYRDWREQLNELVFTNVAGYQWFSPEGKAISHAETSEDDPLIEEACNAAEEDSTEGFRVYSIIGAWSGRPILRVVAMNSILREQGSVGSESP